MCRLTPDWAYIFSLAKKYYAKVAVGKVWRTALHLLPTSFYIKSFLTPTLAFDCSQCVYMLNYSLSELQGSWGGHSVPGLRYTIGS